MAKRPSGDPVLALVEAQASSCRTLAEAIRAHAGSSGWSKRSEGRLLRSWAGMIDAIAEALTEAVHPDAPNPALLRRVWAQSKFVVAGVGFVAGGLAGGMFEAAGTDIYQNLKTDVQIGRTISEISNRADHGSSQVFVWKSAQSDARNMAIDAENISSSELFPMASSTFEVRDKAKLRTFTNEAGVQISVEVLGKVTLGAVDIWFGVGERETLRLVIVNAELCDVVVQLRSITGNRMGDDICSVVVAGATAEMFERTATLRSDVSIEDERRRFIAIRTGFLIDIRVVDTAG
jgi:Cu/Ag efflux protein CusF